MYLKHEKLLIHRKFDKHVEANYFKIENLVRVLLNVEIGQDK